ncbi:hypothetical protein LUZ61_006614 [Rhynchospora tenuis]|uniref:F-box domain-containing protein n=1 Tax=Rhynchospora tenuis TaxID=198213 RepID=A0AAD6EVU5_9POAL|nr:hypothetical protein LUZ61_006614 [Rhynchospora tenuis]
MEPPNKKTRCNDGPAMSHSFPDLSTLPEPLLIHILSFMDPEEAVQTCILSKTWRNLWTCLPSLRFNNCRFKGTDAAFVPFVTNMLYFRGASKLDTFRLCWNVGALHRDICQIHVSYVSAWIFSALSCKPLVISLYLYGFTNLKLPLALFTSASLEQLELHLYDPSNKDIEPKYVNLPNLKKLKLRNFTLNNPVMQTMLSGCPLLEELSLLRCSMNFGEMKSELLRSLTIINCQGSEVVEIFMPSLISLHLEDSSPGKTKLTFRNTPSLVKASVCYLTFMEPNFPGEGLDFFNCLTTVIDLELCGSGVKGLLEKKILNCPIFDNLKQLTCGPWSINEELDVLCQLLQHTPKLEKLTILHDKTLAIPGNPKKKSATGKIPFRCDQLKAIEIMHSDPSGAHELVDILLRNISHSERKDLM